MAERRCCLTGFKDTSNIPFCKLVGAYRSVLFIIFLYSVDSLHVYFTMKIKVKKKNESKIKIFRYIKTELMPALRFSLKKVLKDELSKEENDPRGRSEIRKVSKENDKHDNYYLYMYFFRFICNYIIENYIIICEVLNHKETIR